MKCNRYKLLGIGWLCDCFYVIARLVREYIKVDLTQNKLYVSENLVGSGMSANISHYFKEFFKF